MSIGLSLTFGLYLLVLVGIGVYFFLRTETRRLTDYMLAGRDVGTWPLALSEVASVASGWTFFAWVGVGFTTGLHGLWFSMAMLVVVLFLYRYVAPTFRRQSEALDSQTVVDHLALVFRDSPWGPWIRWTATLAVVVFMASYIGAQIIAVGEAMETGLGLNYAVSVGAGGLAVALYTTLGGFDASVWTDFVQGLLVILAALALPLVAIAEIGGWGAFVTAVRAADPTLLSMTAGQTGTALALSVGSWLAFALGALGQPHGLMRFQAIRSERLLSRASVIALAFQALRLTVPLFIGMAGRVLYGSMNDPESAAMEMMVQLFPDWFAGLLLAGIIGAVLSTSDSMMLVTSADLTRLYETQLAGRVLPTRMIRLGRGIVGVMALLGVGLAYWRPGTIFDIIEFAFVGLGATLGLPLAFLVLWPRTTGAGVFAAVAAGLGSAIGNLYLSPATFPILVWPITLTAFLGASYATAPSSPVTASSS
ncbi:sodium/proline symporter [Salinibacter ruber]|uniref:sodium/proline symporter n=1 Tax=Salinibacter ruber TaxID=146919 RepID=UPI002166D978|nr:sodium/proline symporter [Salinibacter ruber]MCS3755254.1 sodium/proline symporter [Salinibacter ruber]MCS3954925.1 sodium/proline symporter [Salinibacter ruber]MCS4085218.1 sodium/proline symporter [Salinibacter ruber]